MKFDGKQNSVICLEGWRIGRLDGAYLSSPPAFQPSRLLAILKLKTHKEDLAGLIPIVGLSLYWILKVSVLY
jgi:hypothetical protein